MRRTLWEQTSKHGGSLLLCMTGNLKYIGKVVSTTDSHVLMSLKKPIGGHENQIAFPSHERTSSPVSICQPPQAIPADSS